MTGLHLALEGLWRGQWGFDLSHEPVIELSYQRTWCFHRKLDKPESFLATIYKFICLQSNFVPLYNSASGFRGESDLVFRRLPANQFMFAVQDSHCWQVLHLDLGTLRVVALDLCLASAFCAAAWEGLRSHLLQMLPGGQPWGDLTWLQDPEVVILCSAPRLYVHLPHFSLTNSYSSVSRTWQSYFHGRRKKKYQCKAAPLHNKGYLETQILWKSPLFFSISRDNQLILILRAYYQFWPI